MKWQWWWTIVSGGNGWKLVSRRLLALQPRWKFIHPVYVFHPFPISNLKLVVKVSIIDLLTTDRIIFFLFSYESTSSNFCRSVFSFYRNEASMAIEKCQDPKNRSDQSGNCPCNHLRPVVSKLDGKDPRRMRNHCRSARVHSHVASVELVKALRDLRYPSLQQRSLKY